MVTVILTHLVSNFSDWKKAFDAGETFRQNAGVKTLGIYNTVDNANLVSVITEFPHAEAVKAFISNPDLRADMERAGVIGIPEVKILNKV